MVFLLGEIFYFLYSPWGRVLKPEDEAAEFLWLTLRGDIALVEKYNCTGDIQSEPHAVFMGASAFVHLVEFIENKPQILRQDTCTAVFNREVGAVLLFSYIKADVTVFGGELNQLDYIAPDE